MPIRPENKHRYPKDWKLRSRFVRDYRAKGRCEWCGAPQYGVGTWIDGAFHLACGNSYYDNMEYANSYKEAKAVADHLNEWGDTDARQIVIVLTVAHVYDDRPEAANLLNLAALCQRCHNRHDAPDRQRRRKERIERESGQIAFSF